jgi:hypothetical protein
MGWRADRAILATYSADLVVVVASLLALSGCDPDAGDAGSNLELVRAIEQLRGRVRVLAQAGRVVMPQAPRVILALMDQFISQIRTDERHHSWHPKVALIRFIAPNEPAEWRLWLGSRNLTRAMNWDAGLTLCGREAGRGHEVPGIPELAAELADRSKFDRVFFRDALLKVRWQFPIGVRVDRIHFLSKDAILGLPLCPQNTERIIVVSPFLDRQVVVTAGTKWGGPATSRALLSTPTELARIANANRQILSPFTQTRMLNRPEQHERAITSEDISSSSSQVAEELTEEEAAIPEGLHAKLIYFGRKNSHTLWIGSANGSQRAWAGKNYEVVAKLSVSEQHVAALEAFVASGQDFNASEVQAVEPDATDEALEAARKQIASTWDVMQRFEDNQPVLVARVPLDVGDSNIALDVAVLGQAWSRWPDGTLEVKLPAVRPWEQTELIQVRLTLDAKSCAWLQSAPFVQPLPERDKEVIGQYLDMRSFLLWVRSALEGDPVPPEGVPWDQLPGQSRDVTEQVWHNSNLAAAPAIEDVLKAWARAPKAFAAADARVKDYLAAQYERALKTGHQEDMRLLSDFRELWETLSNGLAVSNR